MDWFERLTGFQEKTYDDTRSNLKVEGGRLQSLVNQKDYGVGDLALSSLQDLREKAKLVCGLAGRVNVSVVIGDVRQMHGLSENAGALFQVASQFNLLEMTSPSITPELGVTRYQHDHTQGPACVIAAGAATIYRNYFAPVGAGYGQTAKRQFDGLADIGQVLSHSLNQPVQALWKMQNGYALCTRAGLHAIAKYLERIGPTEKDHLRGKLRIGIQTDVEVTDAAKGPRPLVSQAFCSALPVAYTNIASAHWEPFATLILEAAYEATMWAAVLNAKRGASNVVLLTALGGGAFGNSENWIFTAMHRALQIVSGYELKASLVSYRAPSENILRLVRHFQ